MSDEHSETIGEITKAMSLFQGELETVKKDSENPFFKSKYASLPDIWESIQPLLKANNLAFIKLFGHKDGATVVTGMICHTSGEWFRSSITMTPQKSGPQAVGIVITYMSRYILGMLGVVSEDDDDAEGAMDRTEKKPAKAKGKPPVADTAQRPADYGEALNSPAEQKLENAVLSDNEAMVETKEALKLCQNIKELQRVWEGATPGVRKLIGSDYIKSRKAEVEAPPVDEVEVPE